MADGHHLPEPLRREPCGGSAHEARYRAIFDTAGDAILVIDEEGGVISFNPAAERLFGYGAAEVVGRNIRMLMPEPYHSQHDQYLARYRETGERRIIGVGREVRGRHKNGAIVPLDLAVSETWVSSAKSGEACFSLSAHALRPA